ncbi:MULTISPECIES: nitroreductase family protein [Pseudothermotoga]|jgi:nitroreductase|uniref:Nitroreductase n=1 Tax=Pseudothermotoga lettingae (strain ATCC BAA-301 / DSM 14385 / NBRC 107922 / TMO) TaxID=416591 RepID=A8F8N5_PSELT|nr:MULTISPECIES: nitroreductase family protein [Pseudothermotoga]ABV34519.1 nitroreductase [Pseudothermotoga lettingae TMO]KUK20766.1 MAG: Nitroreductase [Pseudothermotoga lettingae]MDI3494587.1 hypothetical protein [Pseudothermotoga sp.]MDK2883536.1 hypothetical protein [Pseudothermotoga sp.]GLI48535.1 NADH oxidoreductase [Pseudothermotoga lettingae TMO]
MSIIYARRSVRKFQPRDVSEDTILEIIRAAMHAPSAGNEQPWHFVVIKNQSTKEKIAEIHPYAKSVISAPVAVIVCADLSSVKYPGFWVQDCAAATENILLRAAELGLGAVWCGIYPDELRVESFRKFLGLPKDIVAFSLIPIGYPAEKPGTVDRFRKDRLHFERW